jgi:heme exporter protein B
MHLFQEIIILLKKEVVLEWRRKYAFNGILLYIISTIFVCYLSFNLQKSQLNPLTWNALFWIILLFTATNAIAKSFMQESEGRQIYYYMIVSPEAIILSKIIYNTLLMWLMSFIGYLIYSIVLGNPVQDKLLFFINILLGGLGFSTTLSMISAIASKSTQGGTLMAVLGFPVIIPLLLLLIKISKNAMDGLALSISYKEISTLLAVNLIVVGISYLLFPYLWRS